MIERALVYSISAVVVLSVVASALPRITPSLVALGVLVIAGRVAWWYTH